MSEIEEQIGEICYILKEEPIQFNTNVQPKDKSFKSLFEVKRQFICLLKKFVKEKWVENITEADIELEDKEFIAGNFHERKADIVYNVKLENEEMYFILLELQSTTDKMMPHRLLTYMFEIWRKYEKEKKL